MIPKFRLWLDDHQTMLHAWRITKADDGELEVCVDGINKKTKNYVVFYDILVDGQCILMQSTGLFDKNGVEIFEGDVVTLVEESGDFAKSQVTFECGSFGLTIEGLFIPFGALSLMAQVEYSLEIIGNIYENPVEVEL